MKIGDKTYTASKPDDLDAQLIGSTGCNAKETAERLRGNPIAGHVAAALRPFLPSTAPSVPELAAEIDAAGVANVRDQVIALYDAKVPAAAPTKAGPNG